MLTSDGKYKIFIIKHIYKDKEEKGWKNSGDCGQFFAYPYCLRHNEKFKKFKTLQKNFTANGECWQTTGVYGTFDVSEAFDLMNHVAKENPEHRFGVFCVEIIQKTKKLSETKF